MHSRCMRNAEDPELAFPQFSGFLGVLPVGLAPTTSLVGLEWTQGHPGGTTTAVAGIPLILYASTAASWSPVATATSNASGTATFSVAAAVNPPSKCAAKPTRSSPGWPRLRPPRQPAPQGDRGLRHEPGPVRHVAGHRLHPHRHRARHPVLGHHEARCVPLQLWGSAGGVWTRVATGTTSAAGTVVWTIRPSCTTRHQGDGEGLQGWLPLG